MQRDVLRRILFFALIVILAGCNHQRQRTSAAAASSPPAQRVASSTVAVVASAEPLPPAPISPEMLVRGFGARMQRVSTVAAPADAAASIAEAYAGLVDPDLIARWMSRPLTAPGRAASTLWPERIEVTSVDTPGDRSAIVTGEVVEVTTAGDALRYPVRLTLTRNQFGWLITSFERVKDPGPAAAKKG